MTDDQKLHYVDLWMQQSQLLWSRLKVVSVLHSAVLVAWFTLKDFDPDFAPWILFFGIILSVFVIAIMTKDGLYLKSLKDKAEDLFPHVLEASPSGSGCGRAIVFTFIVLEVGLLLPSIL